MTLQEQADAVNIILHNIMDKQTTALHNLTITLHDLRKEVHKSTCIPHPTPTNKGKHTLNNNNINNNNPEEAPFQSAPALTIRYWWKQPDNSLT